MDVEDPLAQERPRSGAPGLPLRFTQLVAGLFGWGLASAFFIRSGLGLGPWDAFHYGLHLQVGISVGMASILAGAVILAATTAAGLRPGLGTLLNMVLVGVFTDLLLLVVPVPGHLAAAVAYFASALLLVGIGSGMYIGAGFGHGPRDGLMVAVALRSGWTVRRVRTLIEASALAMGWLMGATIGPGTIVIVLTIGQSVQWGLRLFGALPHADQGSASRTGGRRSLRRAA
jgi:uncharacterized protein